MYIIFTLIYTCGCPVIGIPCFAFNFVLCIMGYKFYLVVLQRALHPPEVKHERLFVVSVLGFFVNLIGIFVFHHGGASGNLYNCTIR